MTRDEMISYLMQFDPRFVLLLCDIVDIERKERPLEEHQSQEHQDD